MSVAEPRKHNVFQLIPDFQGDWIKISNVLIVGVLIIMSLAHIQYHEGYAAIPIICSVITAGFYLIALANRKSEHDVKDNTYGELMLAALISSFCVAIFPFWYVHSFMTALIAAVIAAVIVTLIWFELMKANDTVFAIFVSLVIISLTYTAYTLPGGSVSKNVDGTYTYHEKADPLGFWLHGYERYFYLSTGSVQVNGLPENWSVSASFDLTKLRNELDSSSFQKVLDVYVSDSASKRLVVEMSRDMNLEQAENPALLLKDWLEEEYAQIPMSVTVTMTVIQKQQWSAP